MQIYLHIAVWRLIIIFLVREEVFEKEFNYFLFASCLCFVIIKLLEIEDNFYILDTIRNDYLKKQENIIHDILFV